MGNQTKLSLTLLVAVGFSFSLSLQQVISGPAAIAGRVELMNNLADLVQWVIENAKPDRVDGLTDSRFAGVRNEVAKLQSWSKSNGVALWIRIARSKKEPNYTMLIGDGLQILGPGRDIVDAAVRSMDSPLILADPPAGYEFSSDDTYFVWARPNSKGEIQFQKQPREATGSLLEKIRDRRAAELANPIASRTAEIELYGNMIEYYTSRVADVNERKKAERLCAEFRDLKGRLEANENKLRSELDRARRLAEANAIVDKFLGAAHFALLLADVSRLVGKSDGVDIKNIKSKEEMKDAILQSIANNMKGMGDSFELIKNDQKKFGVRTEEWRLLFSKNGAPSLLDVRLKEPISFGKGPEFQPK
jgi:hypothetical protein